MAARRARREEDGGEVEVERVNLRGGEIFPTAPCAFSHHYREKAKAKAKAIGIPRTGGWRESDVTPSPRSPSHPI